MSILDELRKACAESESDRDMGKMLADGPLVAHIGYPAPAPPGTIALKIADVVTVVREADIVRTEKDKSLYRIWTSSDANVIVRLEKVTKAAGDPGISSCECDGETESSGTAIARQVSLEIGPVRFLIRCRTQRICTTVFGRPYCYDVAVCDLSDDGETPSGDVDTTPE